MLGHVGVIDLRIWLFINVRMLFTEYAYEERHLWGERQGYGEHAVS